MRQRGQPEDGDSLEFPDGASNKTVTVDDSFTLENITVHGDGYVFNGDLLISNTLEIDGSPVFNGSVTIAYNGVEPTLRIIDGDPVIQDGLVLDLPSTRFTIESGEEDLELPVLTGQVNTLDLIGATGDPREIIRMNPHQSEDFHVSITYIRSVLVECQNVSCFGDSDNFVVMHYSYDDTFSALRLLTPVFNYESDLFDFGAQSLPELIVAQNSKITQDFRTAAAGSKIILENNSTLTFEQEFRVDREVIIESASGTSGKVILKGEFKGTDPIRLQNATLVANSAISGSPQITIAEGGVLAGSGAVYDVEVADGGRLSPGESPGCLAMNEMVGTEGATLTIELAGVTACSGYDQLTVDGAVDLGGMTLELLPLFTPAIGDVFTIITAGSIVGTFDSLPDGATIEQDGTIFRVNYTADAVTLTVTEVAVNELAETGVNIVVSWMFASFIIVSALSTRFVTKRTV